MSHSIIPALARQEQKGRELKALTILELCVDQTDPEFTGIYLPLAPERWD